MNEIALVILGMTAVTYIPRLLPLVLKGNGEPPVWMKRTLQLLPFTAIGALVIPDGFTSIDGNVLVAVIGLAAAAGVTWLTRQPFLAVIAAVLAVAAAQLVL
ncbi:MAG: AzlD domain-containing protein [Spirochaetaceae bacterium]|nr:AzlD domain-containing protein [Spirochaetaceae bacterium]